MSVGLCGCIGFRSVGLCACVGAMRKVDTHTQICISY